MAKLKRGEKTQAARDYLAAHPEASPKEIVAGLATTGMKIKLGLANSIKYSKPRGKKKAGRRGRAPTITAAARHSSNGAVTVEQLIEVKKLADSIGGAEAVRSALDALEQLR
jgi:hypothetical protein